MCDPFGVGCFGKPLHYRYLIPSGLKEDERVPYHKNNIVFILRPQGGRTQGVFTNSSVVIDNW